MKKALTILSVLCLAACDCLPLGVIQDLGSGDSNSDHTVYPQPQAGAPAPVVQEEAGETAPEPETPVQDPNTDPGNPCNPDETSEVPVPVACEDGKQDVTSRTLSFSSTAEGLQDRLDLLNHVGHVVSEALEIHNQSPNNYFVVMATEDEAKIGVSSLNVVETTNHARLIDWTYCSVETPSCDPNRLSVGNLSIQVTTETLRSAFASIGEVVDVKINTDPASGQSLGSGFVTMGSAQEAQNAIAQLNGTLVEGLPLSVSGDSCVVNN